MDIHKKVYRPIYRYFGVLAALMTPDELAAFAQASVLEVMKFYIGYRRYIADVILRYDPALVTKLMHYGICTQRKMCQFILLLFHHYLNL